jgi:hypothetical protein
MDASSTRLQLLSGVSKRKRCCAIILCAPIKANMLLLRHLARHAELAHLSSPLRSSSAATCLAAVRHPKISRLAKDREEKVASTA